MGWTKWLFGDDVTRPKAVAKHIVKHFRLIDQFCHRCGHTDIFHVSNDLWHKVTGKDGDGVYCIRCFDRMAQDNRELRANIVEIGKRVGEDLQDFADTYFLAVRSGNPLYRLVLMFGKAN